MSTSRARLSPASQLSPTNNIVRVINSLPFEGRWAIRLRIGRKGDLCKRFLIRGAKNQKNYTGGGGTTAVPPLINRKD